MEKLVHVVYSNTDYLDVLEIQTDYLCKDNRKCYLFINENGIDLGYLYSRYDSVYFYDNDKTYPNRLCECISQINDTYILLIHDNDILIKTQNGFLDDLFVKTVHLDIDRIDIRFADNIDREKIELDKDNILIKNDIPSNYIYNVNPSIWKTSSLYEIMTNFRHKTYRSIEDMDVQLFCTKYNVYRMFNKIRLKCGYYDCLPCFVFLHITHGGKFLEYNNTMTTRYGQSYIDVYDEYVKIIAKYKLTESSKWIK